MNTQNFAVWEEIIEDARWYPSPHNSQPIKIKFMTDTRAELFYDLDLGLPAENYGKPFGHVCAGVFLESLQTIAAAKGFTVHEDITYSEMDFDAKDRLHSLGMLMLEPCDITTVATERYQALQKRQTSRRPYTNKLVPKECITGARSIAQTSHATLGLADDPVIVKTIIRVNQETLFDDLQNDPVYREIMLWLRFSRSQAAEKRDGLSAETMLMPGRVLKFAMKHRNLWAAPFIGRIIRAVYLRTMRGVRQVGWLEGPFNAPKDYIEAGRVFMKIWIYFTQQGVFLHPFGTVITNPKSHKKFVETVHITESATNMAWMLFRFGYSKQPPKAHRRAASTMIIKGEI